MDNNLINSELPFVSVIMPAYNSGKFIYEAIQSILNQSYSNFELIIIDDGSYDNTLSEITKILDKRIVLLRNEKNRGIVYSLNTAIAVAKGPLIARMDADDISDRQRLFFQILEFKKNPNLILCGTWYKVIFKNITIKKIQLPSKNRDLKNKLFFSNVICHPSCMFKKKLWEKGQGYKEFDVNCEDFGLWLRSINEGDYYNIPKYLLKYRIHDSNVSVTKKSIRDHAIFENIKNAILSNYNFEIFSNDYRKTFASYSDFLKKNKSLTDIELKLFEKHFFGFFREQFGYITSLKFIYNFNLSIIFLEMFFMLTTKIQNLIYKLKIKTIAIILK